MIPHAGAKKRKLIEHPSQCMHRHSGRQCKRWHFNDSSFFQIVIRPPQKRLSSKTNVLAPNVLVSTLTVVIFPAERRVFQHGDDAALGQRVDHFNSQLLHPLPPFWGYVQCRKQSEIPLSSRRFEKLVKTFEKTLLLNLDSYFQSGEGGRRIC